MKPGRILRLCALAAGVLIASAAAGNNRVPSSLDQVATAFDGTGKALERLKDASQSGDEQLVKAALLLYLRSLSDFHTKLASLRTDRQGVGFLRDVAPQVNSEIGAIQILTENAQPAIRPALNAAINHLRSVFELADQTINRRRRLSVKLSVLGPESTNPGAQSWQGPPGIAASQSRVH